MPPVKVKAAVAAAAAISLGHATCCRQSCADPADPRRRPQADAVADPLSVRESAIRFLTHSTHTGPQPQRLVSNPSKRGWVTEVQLTAAAVEHGHGSDWNKARPSALYSSICSLCSVAELAECRA